MQDNTEFQNRVQAIAANVRKAGASAYVGTRLGCLHYLGGAFMPWRGAVVVTADGACEMLYWAMDSSRVRHEGNGVPIHDFYGQGLSSGIAEVLAKLGAQHGTIGLDLAHPGAAQIAPGMLTAGEYFELARTLPDVKFVNGVDWIDDVMLIKSPAEIALLRHAARVSDVGFRAGMAAIAEGVTENHVAGAIEQAIRDSGSVWSWAVTGGTEVGSGLRTGFLRGVTQQSSEKKIERNGFVILDLHPMIEQYLSDTSVAVYFGKPTPKHQAMIECWEDVAATMLASLQPGRPIKDCVAEGVATFARHGFADFGLPLFGHGLGTCARTRPFINATSVDTVTPGMVVALGTHLYVPGQGGMRLEYPTLITDRGAEPLVETPAKVHFID